MKRSTFRQSMSPKIRDESDIARVSASQTHRWRPLESRTRVRLGRPGEPAGLVQGVNHEDRSNCRKLETTEGETQGEVGEAHRRRPDGPGGQGRAACRHPAEALRLCEGTGREGS